MRRSQHFHMILYLTLQKKKQQQQQQQQNVYFLSMVP